MKRIILSILIVSVLFCMLAISASAAATDEFGEVEIVAGMSEKSVFGDDGKLETFTTRVVLYDGTEYHTYPSYYVFTNNVNTTTDFSQLNSLTGKSYGKTSVIRAEVPHNVQKVTGDIFKGYNDLKYVLFPDTLKEISGNMFYTSHGLEWTNVPRDCVSIGAYAFYGCSSLVTIDMTGAKSLKRTEANQFFNCPKLEELIFPEGFEYFGGGGGGGSAAAYQNGLGSLKTLYLPDSVTYMGTISEMKSIGTFTVPLGVTSLRANQFSYCSGLNKLVLHSGITSIPSNTLDMTLYLKEVVYTGSETDAVVPSIKAAFGNVTITYANHCETYFDGVHQAGENNYVLKSFVESFIEESVCINCNLKSTVATYDPIMVFVGYSAKINGDRICVGYTINKESIDVYKAKTGKALTFGVTAAVVADGTTQHQTVNSDLTAVNDKTVIALIDSAYAGFDFIISGFNSDYYEKSLVMGAFVYDGTKIIYIDFGGCNEYATPFTFSAVAK